MGQPIKLCTVANFINIDGTIFNWYYVTALQQTFFNILKIQARAKTPPCDRSEPVSHSQGILKPGRDTYSPFTLVICNYIWRFVT